MKEIIVSLLYFTLVTIFVWFVYNTNNKALIAAIFFNFGFYAGITILWLWILDKINSPKID